MFGSKAPTAGAPLAACCLGDTATEGVVVGVGTVTGNPVEIRLVLPVAVIPLGSTQPEVVVAAPDELIVVMQFSKKPGILPAIAVTWNVDRVSKSQEYPARTEVLSSGDHATPMRGPTAPILSFLNQRSAFT